MTEHSWVMLGLALFGLAMTIIGTLLVLGIKKTLGEMNALWAEIKDINQRQMDLRGTELPRDYLRANSLDSVKSTVDRIEKNLHEFTEVCRKGECWRGRVA